MGEPHKGVMLLRARTRAPWRTSALEALAQCVAKRYVDLPTCKDTAHSGAPPIHRHHNTWCTSAGRRSLRGGELGVVMSRTHTQSVE